MASPITKPKSKLEVFTAQLDKCYNLLSQQAVMIDTMKDILESTSIIYHYYFSVKSNEESETEYSVSFDIYTGDTIDLSSEGIEEYLTGKLVGCRGYVKGGTTKNPLIAIYADDDGDVYVDTQDGDIVSIRLDQGDLGYKKELI